MNKEIFDVEVYEGMYRHQAKVSRGLRAMAEIIIKADKKIIVDIRTTGTKCRPDNNGINDEICKLSIIDVEGNALYDKCLNPQNDIKRCKWKDMCIAEGREYDAKAPTIADELYRIDEILLSASAIIVYNSSVIPFLREAGCVWRSDYDLIDLCSVYEDISANADTAAAIRGQMTAAIFESIGSNKNDDTLKNCFDIRYVLLSLLVIVHLMDVDTGDVDFDHFKDSFDDEMLQRLWDIKI